MAIPIRIKISEMHTSCEIRKKRGKANREPFPYVERTKQNNFGQFNSRAEGREDFYFGFGPFMVAFQTFRRSLSSV